MKCVNTNLYNNNEIMSVEIECIINIYKINGCSRKPNIKYIKLNALPIIN